MQPMGRLGATRAPVIGFGVRQGLFSAAIRPPLANQAGLRRKASLTLQSSER